MICNLLSNGLEKNFIIRAERERERAREIVKANVTKY